MTKTLAKSLCHFHFIDEPQFRSQDSRAHVAHLLRAYRANPRRYSVERCAPGLYLVCAPMSSNIAVIETR